MADFKDEIAERVTAAKGNAALKAATKGFLEASIDARYSYNFHWLGRPIIQYPQDIQAVQELIWSVKPDVVVETGIAHGGSLILSASILAMLDYADVAEAGQMLDPANPKRRVVGVDIDIRAHNRAAIEAHAMAPRITMIEGSAIDPAIVDQVRAEVGDAGRVMVFLDSMHSHAHVLEELNQYGPMVTPGSYCVVFDSVVENLPGGSYDDRPWDIGDNPMTAIREWLPDHPEFETDHDIETRLQVTVAPEGFLRRKG